MVLQNRDYVCVCAYHIFDEFLSDKVFCTVHSSKFEMLEILSSNSISVCGLGGSWINSPSLHPVASVSVHRR